MTCTKGYTKPTNVSLPPLLTPSWPYPLASALSVSGVTRFVSILQLAYFSNWESYITLDAVPTDPFPIMRPTIFSISLSFKRCTLKTYLSHLALIFHRQSPDKRGKLAHCHVCTPPQAPKVCNITCEPHTSLDRPSPALRLRLIRLPGPGTYPFPRPPLIASPIFPHKRRRVPGYQADAEGVPIAGEGKTRGCGRSIL